MTGADKLFEHGGATVVPLAHIPCGEIAIATKAGLAEGVTAWVLDLANVDYLTSMEIAAIIGFRNQIAPSDGQVALANLPDALKTIFRVLKLERLFNLDYDLDAAADLVTG